MTTACVPERSRGRDYFVATHGESIRTHRQLKDALLRFPETKEGNIDAARFLWNYRLWTRVQQLRGLLDYFENRGVMTQEELRRWARQSDFKRDFERKVPGLAFAVYKWLVMRQGVETVKPDVHVRRFVTTAFGRSVTDMEIVHLLENVAKELSRKAYELDSSIWESQRVKV